MGKNYFDELNLFCLFSVKNVLYFLDFMKINAITGTQKEKCTQQNGNGEDDFSVLKFFT